MVEDQSVKQVIANLSDLINELKLVADDQATGVLELMLGILSKPYNSASIGMLRTYSQRFQRVLLGDFPVLLKLINRLGNFEPDDIKVHWPAKPSDSTHKTEADKIADRRRRSIFLVHGHSTLVENVQNYLKSHDIEVIVLRDMPNRGRTVIEKLEAYADVTFAVVLLTPDDIGRAVNEDLTHHRPRQNVVFELGYFIGRLGRENVVALKGGSWQLFSDMHGIVWISLDDKSWQSELLKELQDGGLID